MKMINFQRPCVTLHFIIHKKKQRKPMLENWKVYVMKLKPEISVENSNNYGMMD